MQPAGQYLGEDYYRAGGLPAVLNELMRAGRIRADVPTINGKTIGDNVRTAKALDADVIRPYGKPLKNEAGFRVLRGNLFDRRHHEDERDLRRFSQAVSVEIRPIRMPSTAAPSFSRDLRTITRASTIHRSIST